MSPSKQTDKFYSRFVTSSGFLLTEKLHKLFIKYIKEGRCYVPESKELEDLIPTFQNGAKTNRKSIQNKFKSWSKRMDVRNDDDSLILKQGGKPKVIVPQEQHAKLIMSIHLSSNSSYSEGSKLPTNTRHKTVDEIVEEIKKEYTWTRKNFGLDWDIVASVIASKCDNEACLQKLKSRFEPRPSRLVKQANLLLIPPKSSNVNQCLRTNKAPPYSQRTTALDTPRNCPQQSRGFYLLNKIPLFEDQSVSAVSSAVKANESDHWSPTHTTVTCIRLPTKSLTSVLQQHPSHKTATESYAQMYLATSNKSILTSSENMSHYTNQPRDKILNRPMCLEPAQRQVLQEAQKNSMMNSPFELPSFLQNSINFPRSFSLSSKSEEVPTTTVPTVVYLIDPSYIISTSRTFKVTLPMPISSSTSSSQVSVVPLINNGQPINPLVSKEISTTLGSVKQQVTKSFILDTSLPTVLEPTLISPCISVNSEKHIKCSSREENSSSVTQSSKPLVTTDSTISGNVVSSMLSDNYFYSIQTGFIDDFTSLSSNDQNYRTGEVTANIVSLKRPISSSQTTDFSKDYSSHEMCTVNAQVPYSQSHIIPIVTRSDPSHEHSYYFSGEALKSTCSRVSLKSETNSSTRLTEQAMKEKRKKKSYSRSKCKISKTVSFANENNTFMKKKCENNFKDSLTTQSSSFSNQINGRECSRTAHHKHKVRKKKKEKRQSEKRNCRKRKKTKIQQKHHSGNTECIYSKLLKKIKIIGRCLRPAIAESEENLSVDRLLKGVESSLKLVSILKSRTRFNKKGAKL